MTLSIGPIFVVLGVLLGLIVLAAIFVPLLSLIGRFIAHVSRFIFRMVSDILRAIGAVIAALVFVPIILGSIIIGRWSAASHYGRAWQGEVKTLGLCLYRVALSHPLRLLGLHSIVAGLEERVPQALADAPGPDTPSRRTGQFEGYRIVGSLPGGGSGSKLYIAEPDEIKLASLTRAGHADLHRVVIKSFSLADGSSLPQIIRESRSLEAAKRMGLVLDHDQTNERFFYVMRYVPGQPLGAVVHALHAESEPSTPPGLDDTRLKLGLGYVCDLLRTLDAYHRGGLWHKDVKPDNIIVDGTVAHLVDFGLLTHLRSAMTLTTHGTEYFRDPELVRMALRGVKVHEVDGVLFDVYAVGAVLYSVVENSFPAHGALSQVSSRCPDAVKWIIRRAMTDYDKRYRSASDMLNDLAVVASAQHPMSVRPVALPSMGGASVSPETHQPQDQPAAAYAQASPRAGSPIPPPIPPRGDTSDFKHRVAGLAAAAAKLAEEAVHKAEAAVQQAARKTGLGSPTSKPSPRDIKVRNWWTGTFEVVGPSIIRANPPTPPHAHIPTPPPIPTPARSRFAAPAAEFVVRRPAADQLKSAQARIKSARQRIDTRLAGRRRSRPEAAPAGFNAGIAFALFAAIGLVGTGVFLSQHRVGTGVSQSTEGTMVTIESWSNGGDESTFFEQADAPVIVDRAATVPVTVFDTQPSILDTMPVDRYLNDTEDTLAADAAASAHATEGEATANSKPLRVLVVSDISAPWPSEYEHFLRAMIDDLGQHNITLTGDVFDLVDPAPATLDDPASLAAFENRSHRRAEQIEVLATLRAEVGGLDVGSSDFAQVTARWLDNTTADLDAVMWISPSQSHAAPNAPFRMPTFRIIAPESFPQSKDRVAQRLHNLTTRIMFPKNAPTPPTPPPAPAPPASR